MDEICFSIAGPTSGGCTVIPITGMCDQNEKAINIVIGSLPNHLEGQKENIMGEWNRTTKEIDISLLRMEVSNAIKNHSESFNLGNILDNVQICIETTSEKKKKGLFGGGEKPVCTCVVITPDWLVIYVRQNDSDGAVSSVPMGDLAAEDYANSPMCKLMPDSGVHITGAFTGRIGQHGSQRTSQFIGLGEEPAATRFKAVLFAKVERNKKT